MSTTDRSAPALFASAREPILRVAEEADGWCIRASNCAFSRAFEDTDLEATFATGSDLPPGTTEYELLTRVSTRESVADRARRETRNGWRVFRVEAIAAGDEAYLEYVDITEQTCHRQQLAVFQRVLSHDLRNQMNIILGCAPDQPGSPEPVANAATELLRAGGSLGQLAVLDEEPQPMPIVEVLGGIDREYTAVDVSLPETSVHVDHRLGVALEVLFETLASAAGDRFSADLEVHLADATVCVEVALPADAVRPLALAALRGEEEKPLSDPPDLGYWVVHWIVTAAGGLIGTTSTDRSRVTVRLPLLSEKST